MAAAARDSEGEVECELGGQWFTVLPHGVRGFQVCARNGSMIVLINPRFKPKNPGPTVVVHFLSEFLWSAGYEQAFAQVDAWARQLGEVHRVTLARVDLAVDWTGWRPTVQHFGQFVTRALKRRMHIQGEDAEGPEGPGECYAWGNDLTGFRFGAGGDIVARVYDKTRELVKSGKRWFYDVWKLREEDAPEVWRLEYQVRRQALKEMRLRDPETGEDLGDDVAAALRNLGPIWRYLAADWCSLRRPTENVQRARWPLHRAWEALVAAPWAPSSRVLVRESRKNVRLEQLIPQVVGLLSSVGGVLRGGKDGVGPDTPAAALAWAAPWVARYLSARRARGSSFTIDTERKAIAFEVARQQWGEPNERENMIELSNFFERANKFE